MRSARSSTGKDVWKNFRRNMLFARAISNGVAFYTPDVTTTRVYVEGELDDVPARRARSPALAADGVDRDDSAGLARPEVVVDAEPVRRRTPLPFPAESLDSPRA
jgi:hypothetical protein